MTTVINFAAGFLVGAILWALSERRVRRVRKNLTTEVSYWIGERDRWRNIAERECAAHARTRNEQAIEHEHARLRLN